MKIKWIFDRAASFFGLILLSPILILIAIVIKLTDVKNPVFFKQLRIGQYGRPFHLYKFRTMRPNQAEPRSGSFVTVAGDRRITRVGPFLRKYKLDELPELWNVLKGDMSFVGPRPDVPGYADRLEGADRRILDVKPGITGPASIKYRSEEEMLSHVADPLEYNDTVVWPDKVRINLEYLDKRSFFGDLCIIFKTIGIIR